MKETQTMVRPVLMPRGSGLLRANIWTTKLLAYAAAPTFWIMAVLDALSNGSTLMSSSMHMHGASLLSGMATMYLLMGFFHLTPWLRLLTGSVGTVQGEDLR